MYHFLKRTDAKKKHLIYRKKSEPLQPGGFSANAQPIDQVHHVLRARLDLCDASDLGCQADLRSRERITTADDLGHAAIGGGVL